MRYRYEFDVHTKKMLRNRLDNNKLLHANRRYVSFVLFEQIVAKETAATGFTWKLLTRPKFDAIEISINAFRSLNSVTCFLFIKEKIFKKSKYLKNGLTEIDWRRSITSKKNYEESSVAFPIWAVGFFDHFWETDPFFFIFGVIGRVGNPQK